MKIYTPPGEWRSIRYENAPLAPLQCVSVSLQPLVHTLVHGPKWRGSRDVVVQHGCTDDFLMKSHSVLVTDKAPLPFVLLPWHSYMPGWGGWCKLCLFVCPIAQAGLEPLDPPLRFWGYRLMSPQCQAAVDEMVLHRN